MEALEFVRGTFSNAAERASLALSSADMDGLAKKAAFSLYLQPDTFAESKRFRPHADLVRRVTDPAKLAEDLRFILGASDVDPLFHLPTLLEGQLNVLIFPLAQTSIGGACAMFDETAFIFVSTTTEVETLYTCARQLGHLLVLPARKTRGVSAIIELPHENTHPPRGAYKRFADLFALELLVPTRGLGIALREVRKLLKVSSRAVGDIELLYLARIFGVSFLAIARRCERAQLLPKGGATVLYQFLLDKFGGPETRANDLDLPPRPAVEIAPAPRCIVSAAAERIRKGELSLEQASGWLGLSSVAFGEVSHSGPR